MGGIDVSCRCLFRNRPLSDLYGPVNYERVLPTCPKGVAGASLGRHRARLWARPYGVMLSADPSPRKGQTCAGGRTEKRVKGMDLKLDDIEKARGEGPR